METVADLPRYLEADTKDELIRLMLLNNVKNKKHFKYFNIQKEDKKWIAWYYTRVRLETNGSV